ncbi:succinate dehydrogenase assembly factor 2 [Gammaproteobacteria bacterium]|jgi:antitoxin CptB|nr:succinate dehydrogenase assembly factor 2 [Gammaproteobacteria bacterium]MDA7747436.1 succinate dehydrogenase assembly factor 2 [Gammaproteobacteria bacterium]MDA7844778.1 succinate dehydrogenase assembly factor 2 [Gammaproteobacteria bacterium]MDA9102112.1 succinate dehydrogenase assembly factor 2 [Gammaproteobacteria bacterium]
MNQEINRIHWKCRRGMREIDLLLREFANGELLLADEKEINIFDDILDYDDQKLFDYIFKGVSLSNDSHEIFIDKHLKKFTKQGNF